MTHQATIQDYRIQLHLLWTCEFRSQHRHDCTGLMVAWILCPASSPASTLHHQHKQGPEASANIETASTECRCWTYHANIKNLNLHWYYQQAITWHPRASEASNKCLYQLFLRELFCKNAWNVHTYMINRIKLQICSYSQPLNHFLHTHKNFIAQ